MNEPVDAVICWVDGNDSAHAEKLRSHLANLGIPRPIAASPTRYNECGEINYCVKSLLQFAPWLRTIYIVTGSQTPPIIRELIGTSYEKKVKIIDEREIFRDFETYLPTFNSISLESLLWRIPGLANNFIYLNDDWMLIRPVSYVDFFRDNKIVLRGEWKIQSERKWDNYWQQALNYILRRPQAPIERDLYRMLQENSAKLVGWKRRYLSLPHAPLPVKKKTFEDFFSNYPDLLVHNIHYAFRDRQQFLPLALAQYIEIKQNNAVFDKHLAFIYVDGSHHSLEKIQRRLDEADKKQNAAFMCMQSLDITPDATRKMMFEWLEKRIGAL